MSFPALPSANEPWLSGVTGTFEVFFSVACTQRDLPRPLLFHHIPKTAGTSFRSALRRVFVRRQCGLYEVPRFREKLRARSEWPEGILAIFHHINNIVQIEAIAGHYTAALAGASDDPIYSLVRDPDRHIFSIIKFRSKRISRVLQRSSDPIDVLRSELISNPQMRSLTGRAVPTFEPSDPEIRAYWLEQVDNVCRRFSLFRTEGYPYFVGHIEEQFSLRIPVLHSRRARDTEEARMMVRAISPLLKQSDPLWLDRLLYAKAQGG